MALNPLSQDVPVNGFAAVVTRVVQKLRLDTSSVFVDDQTAEAVETAYNAIYVEFGHLLMPYLLTLAYLLEEVVALQQTEGDSQLAAGGRPERFAHLLRAQLGPYETALIAHHCNSNYGTDLLPLVRQSGLLAKMTWFDAGGNILVPKSVLARINASN